MQPDTQAPTQVQDAQQQLADIKKRTSEVVNLARKQDPNIKVNVADAEKIGLKLDVPTQKTITPTAPELSRVGTTPIAKTGLDTAKEALLASVPEEDRDTISAILDVSTGLQTEQGRALEDQLTGLSQDRLNLAESSASRKRERGDLLTEARLPEAEAELESIRAEADVLSAKRNAAIQAEARREGTSTFAQSSNISAIEKDFNLQQANLAIRELASVGKINAATKLIDSKLDIKYGDIEAETELVKAQIESILPLLSREDAKVANTRLLLNEQVKAKMEEARADDKALEEFKLQSYLFAQQNGASPAVLSNIMSSESREDVASVGGTFIEDPMQKLQREREQKEINQIGAVVGGAGGGTIAAVANAALLGTADDPILAMIQASAGGRTLTQSEVTPLTNARRVTSQLEAIISSDIADNTGPLMGIIRSANPFDVKAQELKASITALIPQLARGIYGEVGVLTDSDVNRYIQTLPNLKSTADVNKAVMGLTLRNVRNAFASQLESMAAAGRDVSGFTGIYTDMNNQINKIESDLGIGSASPMTDEALDSEFESFNTSQSSAQSIEEDDSPGFWKSVGNFFFGK